MPHIVDDPVWRCRLAYPILPELCVIKEAGRRVELRLRKALTVKWEEIGKYADVDEQPMENHSSNIPGHHDEDIGKTSKTESLTAFGSREKNITNKRIGVHMRVAANGQESDDRTSNVINDMNQQPINQQQSLLSNGYNISDDLEPLDLEVPPAMLPADTCSYSEVCFN